MLANARAEEAVAEKNRIPLLDAEVHTLHTQLLTNTQEHQLALSHLHLWEQEVLAKLQATQTENEALVEKCSSLLLDASVLENARLSAVEELKEKSDRYMITLSLIILF